MVAFKVTLSLGLVSVPARVSKATDDPVVLKTLCVGQEGHPEHAPIAIKAPATCEECGRIGNYSSLKKGLPSGAGYVVVDQADIAAAKAETVDQFKGKIDLAPFRAEQFNANTAQGKALSYLSPEPGQDADRFALLVALVEAHPEIAFAARYTPRSRAGLYVVRAKDGILMLEERTLLERMREAPTSEGTPNEALLAQFEAFLPMLITDFDPATYTDAYAAALTELTAAGDVVMVGDTTAPVTAAPAATVSDDDLVAQLAALAASAKPKKKKKAS